VAAAPAHGGQQLHEQHGQHEYPAHHPHAWRLFGHPPPVNHAAHHEGTDAQQHGQLHMPHVDGDVVGLELAFQRVRETQLPAPVIQLQTQGIQLCLFHRGLLVVAEAVHLSPMAAQAPRLGKGGSVNAAHRQTSRGSSWPSGHDGMGKPSHRCNSRGQKRLASVQFALNFSVLRCPNSKKREGAPLSRFFTSAPCLYKVRKIPSRR